MGLYVTMALNLPKCVLRLQDTPTYFIHCELQMAGVGREGPFKKALGVVNLFRNTDHFQKMCTCPIF